MYISPAAVKYMNWSELRNGLNDVKTLQMCMIYLKADTFFLKLRQQFLGKNSI